jgi:hypothetical protein
VKYPNIIKMTQDWVDSLDENQMGIEITKGYAIWVPKRTEGFPSAWQRLRAAWLVFTGRADALIWFGEQ